MVTPRLPRPGRRTYSVAEAAERLGVSQKTVRSWIERGHLSGRRHGPLGHFRIPMAQVDALGFIGPDIEFVPPGFLTREQAAEQLGISARTLRRWQAEGRVRGARRGSLGTDRWLIPLSEVERIREGGFVRTRAS